MLFRCILALLLSFSIFAAQADAQMAKRVSQSDLDSLKQELSVKELAIKRWEAAIDEARSEGNEERAKLFQEAKAKAEAEVAPARALLEEAQSRYKRQHVEADKR